MTEKKPPILAMVSAMHNKMEAAARDICLQVFQAGSSRVLIASESLARGIKSKQVSLVINFNLPLKPEDYIHRIGRVNRPGSKGVAVNIVTDEEMLKIREIESLLNTRIEEMPDNFAELI